MKAYLKSNKSSQNHSQCQYYRPHKYTDIFPIEVKPIELLSYFVILRHRDAFILWKTFLILNSLQPEFFSLVFLQYIVLFFFYF